MRRRFMPVLLVALFAACGGSGDAGSDGDGTETDVVTSAPVTTQLDDSTPTSGAVDQPADSSAPAPTEPDVTEAPAQDIAADAAAASAALLTLSDFPLGWSAVPDESDENDERVQQRAYECLGPDAVQLFNSETKALSDDFVDPVDDSAISQTVSFAPSVAVAEAYIAGGSSAGVGECLAALYREELPKLAAADQGQETEIGEITVGGLNVGQLGDGTFAYRITVPLSIEGFKVDIVLDFVAVRVGRSVTGLNFYSVFSPAPIEEIIEYSTLAASRLPG